MGATGGPAGGGEVVGTGRVEDKDMSDPVWYQYLQGQDDDPLIIPVGYDGSITLPDRGWQGLMPRAQEAFTTLAAAALKAEWPIRMTEGFRPRRRQAYLYALGRVMRNPNTPKGVAGLGDMVTDALPGKSNHQHRRAFDICLTGRPDAFNKEGLTVVGNLGVSQGLEWGGNWTGRIVDRPHFQVPA